MLLKLPPRLGGKYAILKYLEADLYAWLKDVYSGILKITFTENFESFEVDNLLIKNGQEVLIPNQLKTAANNSIPSSRIIVRQSGNGFVTDGPTKWTSDAVYLFNNGPSDTTINVIFFR